MMTDNEIIEEFLQCKPVDDVSIRRIVNKLVEENRNLKNAILTGQENRLRYAGKVTERLHSELVCECGETIIHDEYRKVPWAVISNVLKLVQKTAKLS